MVGFGMSIGDYVGFMAFKTINQPKNRSALIIARIN